MKKMKWAVTGAAGFLGSHVVEQLTARGDAVLGIDNLAWGQESHIDVLKKTDGCRFEKVDIRDLSAMKTALSSFAPDAVVHLAALHFIPEAVKNPSLAIDINVRGTQTVLEAARETNCQKIWFASTGDVYCKTDDDNTEGKTATEPYNIYGLSKWIGEQLMALESSNQPQRRYIIGRIYNLIGPRETNPHIVPEIIKQLKQNPKQLSLGSIWPVRDYVPVDHCAKALIDMCEKATDNLTCSNVCTGHGQSVKDLIDAIQEQLGHKIEVQEDPARVRKVERTRLVGSVERLRGLIGWSPSPKASAILRDLLIHEGLLKK